MRLSRRSWLLLPLLACGPSAANAEPPTLGERYVSAARELLEVRYHFGGRMKAEGDGIDCQGVLFYAAERVGRCGWKSFSVYPTQSVAHDELGHAVPGLAPVASAELDLSKLQMGDVILLVSFGENPAEPAIAKLEGKPVWVLHTGLYSGDGKWIVGDHFAGRVVETDLATYLVEHADVYAGVFVTRMNPKKGPSPQRCRTGPKMKRP